MQEPESDHAERNADPGDLPSRIGRGGGRLAFAAARRLLAIRPVADAVRRAREEAATDDPTGPGER